MEMRSPDQLKKDLRDIDRNTHRTILSDTAANGCLIGLIVIQLVCFIFCVLMIMFLARFIF